MATKTVSTAGDATTAATGSNDIITVIAALNSGTVDLGNGSDKLILKGDGNILTVTKTETVIGSTGSDSITASDNQIKFVDLGKDDDTLTLNVASTLQVANTESIIGSGGADKVTLTTAAKGVSVEDVQTLILNKTANIVFVDNVLTVTGGALSDVVTVDNPPSGAVKSTFNLGAGNDKLQLSDANSEVTVVAVETVVGGTGDDTVKISGAQKGGLFNLGEGSDTLTLSAGLNNITVKAVEAITGNTGADTITVASKVMDGTLFDLGAGNDKVVLGDYANSISVANVETVTGGKLADVVTISGTAGGTFNLGAGIDTLVFDAAGGTHTASSVETVTGGTTGDDKIVLGAQVGGTNWTTGVKIDLGTSANGHDVVQLGDFANTLVTVMTADSIVGGKLADSVQIGDGTTAAAVGYINLGDGNDTLTISALGATIEISKVESVVGSVVADIVTVNGGSVTLIDLNGDNASTPVGDTVKLAGTVALTAHMAEVAIIDTATGNGADDIITYDDGSAQTVNLGDGEDKLILGYASGNELTILNVESVVGAGGNDKIHVTAQTAYLDLGAGTGDEVVLGGAAGDVNSVTLKGVETVSLDATTAGTTDQSDDRVTFADTIGTSGSHFTIDLGAGTNRVNLSDTGSNYIDVTKVGIVMGGSGADNVTVTDAVSTLVDLGDGTDALTLSVATTLSVGSAETITANDSAGGYDISLKANYDTVATIAFNASASAANKVELLGATSIVVTGGANITGSIRDDIVDLSGDGIVDLDKGYDTITLRGGDHTVTGGTGADEFHFVSAATGTNKITDFASGTDSIVLDSGVISGSTLNRLADDTSSFTGGGTAEYVYDTSAKTLTIDKDGDGTGDITITLNGMTSGGSAATTFDSGDLAWL